MRRASPAWGSWLRFALSAAVVVVVASQPRGARAADAAAVESVSTMNRKALEEYDNLAFDGARKTLEAALEACERTGLDRHPVAGASAIAEFRKALDIQPGVKLPDRIANPEIQAAIDQAAAAVKRSPPVSLAGDGDDDDDDDDDGDGNGEEEEVGKAATRKRPVAARAPSWLIGLGVGRGLGWTSGTGEVTNGQVESGFRPAAVVHILLEVGYFVNPGLLLSIQLRVQLIEGATAERDRTMTICGSDHICSPGTGATAVLARAAWFLGDGVLRPYLSGTIGAGQLRHVASVPGRADCGVDPARPTPCVDTVDSGPVFVGPGGGVSYAVTRGFALAIGVGALFGFPSFTFNTDLNVGVAVEM